MKVMEKGDAPKDLAKEQRCDWDTRSDRRQRGVCFEAKLQLFPRDAVRLGTEEELDTIIDNGICHCTAQ